MSSKIKSFRNQFTTNPNTKVAMKNQFYIGLSRLEVDYDLNGRNKEEVEATVTLEDAKNACLTGITTPIEVVKASNEAISEGIHANKYPASLISGFRRITMVKLAIQNGFFGMPEEDVAFWDAEAKEAYVPVRDLAGIKHLDLKNPADNLLYQLQANNHEAWGIASRVETCIKLIDQIKQDSKGNPLTAEVVATYVGVSRVTVQSYLRIGRSEGMMEIIKDVPNKLNIMEYVAGLLSNKVKTGEEVLAAIAACGDKVTLKKLHEVVEGVRPQPSPAPTFEPVVDVSPAEGDTGMPEEAPIQVGETVDLTDEPIEEEATEEVPKERAAYYNFCNELETAIGLLRPLAKQLDKTVELKSIQAVMEMCKERMDAHELTEMIMELWAE